MSSVTDQHELYTRFANLRKTSRVVRSQYTKVIAVRDETWSNNDLPPVAENPELKGKVGAAYAHLDEARKLLREVYEDVDQQVREMRA